MQRWKSACHGAALSCCNPRRATMAASFYGTLERSGSATLKPAGVLSRYSAGSPAQGQAETDDGLAPLDKVSGRKSGRPARGERGGVRDGLEVLGASGRHGHRGAS